MKKGIYTITFMIIITVIFIAALAFVNEVTRAAIEQNLQVDRYKSILYAFDIFPKGFTDRNLSLTNTTDDIPWNKDAVLQAMKQNIRPVTLQLSQEQKSLLEGSLLGVTDSIIIDVQISSDDHPIAYGFPLKGKGLWGTITAFAVIDSSLQHMVGIDFTEQVETPGLGARILEQEFKYFFRNLDISKILTGAHAPIIMVQRKQKSNIEDQTNSFQTITGATQTVTGVLKMVNSDLKFYVTTIRAHHDDIRELISQAN
ncbi:FMN-binding protein [candidate division KSB1 bacterium]|nr:FMN-binding protein [candidate division KSB1 bacterium]